MFGNEDIKALIGFQQQKSLLGCEDTSCLAELGGALGAQEIITGNLSLLADDYVLVLRRLLVAKAQVIEETTRSVPHSEPARLRAAIHSGVGELFGILPAPLAAVSVPAAAPSRGPRVWPWVLGAGALAAAGASVWGFVQVANFQSFRSASQTPGSQVTLAQAQSSQSSAQVGQVVGIAGAIGAAALATGAVLTW